ncbi:MAG: pseudaminic acid synthase [Rhodospirillales bacterium]|nr:pseudaminic acid synthase [Rhodospirillales bacterium]
MVAELSGNHNGDLGRALALIDAAHAAGADAVKLQTYTADTLTLDHDGPQFCIASGPWAGRRLYDLYDWAHTPWDWHEALFARAHALGLSIFSAPFDPTAVAFLERFRPPAYKIASFELVDLPLIECAAATGRPLILSTGLASPDEVDEAVAAARRGRAGGGFDADDNDWLLLLHCVSGYPSAPGEARLGAMTVLRRRTGLAVGLSDHSLGTAVAVAGTALGAAMIEKHLILRRAYGGPDAGFSMESHEFAALCRDCRLAWEATAARPPANDRAAASERPSAVFRRSLFVVDDVAAGAPLTPANVRSIRPAGGLAPKFLPEVIGRRAARALSRGSPLAWDMIAP